MVSRDEAFRNFSTKRGLMLLLVLLALSTIIDGLDSSIVNVALPTMSSDFHIPAGDSSWITLVYILALASLLLPLAKVAKNGTVRRMFVYGVIVFTVSSVLCGLAWDFLSIVVFRLVQGVGAAMMTAATPVLISEYIPVDRKGLGMGVLAIASGIAVVIGPSVGGLITQFLSWHWIFFVNVPFGAFTILLALKILPKDEGYSPDANPDLINSMLTAVGVSCTLMFAQNVIGDCIPRPAVYTAGVAAALSFGLLAYRVHRNHSSSPVSVDLLKRRDFQLLALAFTMTTMIIMGTEYVLPYQLQIAGGYDAGVSGGLLSIASIFAIILSVPIGRWCDTRGCKVPSVLAGVARLVFCFIFIIASPKDDLALLVVGLVVMGCSMALAGTGLSTAMIHHSGEDSQGDAATMMLEVNYTAASMGVAVYSLIFDNAIGHTAVRDIAPNVLRDAFNTTMLLGCVLAVVAIICAVVVKNIVPEHKTE